MREHAGVRVSPRVTAGYPTAASPTSSRLTNYETGGTPLDVLFADLTGKRAIILMHSHRAVSAVLAVIFLSDNLRERGQCP